jgi:hypothetical protein
MLTDQQVIELVLRANPVHDSEDLPGPRVDAHTLVAAREKGPAMTTKTRVSPEPTAARRWYRRPAVAFFAAFATIASIVSIGPLLMGGDSANVEATSTAAQPTTTVPPAPPPDGIVRVVTSNGVLVAWEYQDGTRAWQYSNGGWVELPAVPDDVSEMAFGAGKLWALTPPGPHYLDGDVWRNLEGAPPLAWRFAVDNSSGELWLSTGEDLYTWDGDEFTKTAQPDVVEDDGFAYVGDIAVTTDGTVWAGGLYGYVPWVGSLMSYDAETDAWKTARPWNGKPVPASSLVSTNDGGLWVVLLDADSPDTTDEPSTEGWALAFRDGATGQWAVFDEDLPGGFPFAVAAADDAIWMAQGYAITEGEAPLEGLYRFDGTAWSHYLDGQGTVLDVAVAPDGTVWYLADQEPHVLRQLEP